MLTPVAYQPPGLEGDFSLGQAPEGMFNLEVGFPLRCFQRLSIPNLATQLTSEEITGTPAVGSLRSSRTRSKSSQTSNAHSG